MKNYQECCAPNHNCGSGTCGHLTQGTVECSGASSLKKGGLSCKGSVCITFQHKNTFSLETRNQPINFVMLPKYHISKYLPIHSISAIVAHKSGYSGFLQSVQKPKLLCRLWLMNAILCIVPYDTQPSDYIK